ncbi:MAG: ATP-binding protein [Proteobacteria bacterium]|nr:ATP-binding protein [Pseudomonadota bacterium]
MPLFRGQVTWDDVKGLISQEAPEHELLDYKEYRGQLSKRVVCTIGAMANTYGGDILLGVAEDDYGKPRPLSELTGIPKDQAASIIESIEGQNWTIRPPVLGLTVEQVDIPSSEHRQDSGDHCVLVVRVMQSDLVPHWIPRSGHYGRAGSQNKPFRDVHLPTERIQWLLNRRSEHVSFRRRLLDWVDGLQGGIAWHKVWCVPLFPSPAHALWPLDEARVLDEGSCPEVGGPEGPVPFAEHGLACQGVARTVQHGWVTQASEQHRYVRLPQHPALPRRGCMTHVVDHRGLAVVKGITFRELTAGSQRLEPDVEEAKSEYIAFDWYTVNLHLLGVCHQAATVYASCGYVGPVQFGIELGVNPAGYGGHVYLGASYPDIAGSHMVLWGEPVKPLTRTASMAEPAGRVTETHECLARGLVNEVWNAVGESAWTRAFNVQWRSDSLRAQRCTELLRNVFVVAES